MAGAKIAGLEKGWSGNMAESGFSVADPHFVIILRFGVEYPEGGKDRFFPDIGNDKTALFSELLPQGKLPDIELQSVRPFVV